MALLGYGWICYATSQAEPVMQAESPARLIGSGGRVVDSVIPLPRRTRQGPVFGSSGPTALAQNGPRRLRHPASAEPDANVTRS